MSSIPSSVNNATSSTAETKPAPEDWQHRPPYLAPSAYGKESNSKTNSETSTSSPFDKKLQATCHCGRVIYYISRDAPLASKYCHCNDCQTMHGAPFQWAAIFHKADVAFEHGVRDLAFYDAANKKDAHGLPCKVSCSYCGSRIMDEGRNMLLVFPPLIKFEGDEGVKEKFAPQMHIFYTKRVLDIVDGKPKWDGLDGRSNLVSEKR